MPQPSAKYLPALSLLILLSSCQTAAPVATSPPVSRSLETATGEADFQTCYQLDATASELRLLVYKTGPLARVGHNHVIVSHGLTGTLARTDLFSSSKARIVLPVASLEVDPVALRAEEGADFSSDVSDEARAGTLSNMLGDGVLNAALYPDVTVELMSLTGPQWSADAILRITLAGQVREQSASVSLLEEAGVIRALSSFSISQSEFGMTPFSVLGGGLRVADEVKIRVNLTFTPMAAGDVGNCSVR